MQTKVQMWGNSLALRIPKSFAVEIGLENDTAVDLTLVEGNLMIRPLRPSCFTLDELLAGITEQNLHGEIDSGESVGKEVW